MNTMNLKEGFSIAWFSIMLVFSGQVAFADTTDSDIGKKTIQLCNAGRAEFTNIWQEGKQLSESEFKDTYGHNKLDAAAVSANWRVVHNLIREYGKDSDQATRILDQAATAGRADIVAKIVEYGVSPDGNNIHVAPLVSAASCGRIDTVNLLLDYGANPNIQNIQLQDAMMQAIVLSNKDIALSLINHGYDSCANKTKDGRNINNLISELNLAEGSSVWQKALCNEK